MRARPSCNRQFAATHRVRPVPARHTRFPQLIALSCRPLQPAFRREAHERLRPNQAPAHPYRRPLACAGFYNALIASIEKGFVQDTPLLDQLAASLLASDTEFDQLAGTAKTANVTGSASPPD